MKKINTEFLGLQKISETEISSIEGGRSPSYVIGWLFGKAQNAIEDLIGGMAKNYVNHGMDPSNF